MFQEDQLGLSLLTLEQLQSDEMQNKLTQRAHSLMWGTRLTHFVTHSRHTHFCDTQEVTHVRYREYTLSCDTHRAWGEREYTSQYRQVIQPLVPETVSGLQKDPQQQSVLYRICLHMSVYVCYLSDSLSNSYLEKRRYVFRAVITVRCETRLNFQQSLQSRTLSVLVGQQT